MWKYLILLNFLSTVCAQSLKLKFWIHPDANLNFEQTVTKYGYPFESYRIVTEDGYILNVFRMPHGKNSTTINKHPVLLAHGTSASSDLMIIIGPGKGLAYYLADQGFDVWLINHRGSIYSPYHKYLDNRANGDYWNFDWHEIGVYDYSATIDLILNKTKENQIFFIGHSQGTTSYFPLVVTKPEYNKKIKFTMLLGPSVFIWHDKNPFLRLASRFANVIHEFAYLIGFRKIMPYNEILLPIFRMACSEMTVIVDFCRQILYYGSWSTAMENEIVQMVFRTAPTGASIRQLIHYGQIVDTGKFAQFDFGPEGNLQRYGSINPPIYNLNLSSVPLGFFFSETDFVTPESQIPDLQHHIPNVTYIKKISKNYAYSHVDFLFARNADEIIYKPIVKVFKDVLNNKFP